MEWFFERFDMVFAGWAPHDIFGCGLCISLAMQIAFLMFKTICKGIDLFFDWLAERVKRSRK